MYCPGCGTPLESDARFCPACGAWLSQRPMRVNSPVRRAVGGLLIALITVASAFAVIAGWVAFAAGFTGLGGGYTLFGGVVAVGLAMVKRRLCGPGSPGLRVAGGALLIACGGLSMLLFVLPAVVLGGSLEETPIPFDVFVVALVGIGVLLVVSVDRARRPEMR